MITLILFKEDFFLLVDTSPIPNIPSAAKSKENTTVLAVVSVVAACLLIVVVVILVIKCRKSYKRDLSATTHEEFGGDFIKKTRDGSIHAQNPLHDMINTSDVIIEDGTVQYHRNNEDHQSALAFSNINYDTIQFHVSGETNSENEISDDHVIEHEDTKPLGVNPEVESSTYATMNPNFSASGIQAFDDQQNNTQKVRVTIEHFTRSLSECKEIPSPEDKL